jgi:hypothetical protein
MRGYKAASLFLCETKKRQAALFIAKPDLIMYNR